MKTFSLIRFSLVVLTRNLPWHTRAKMNNLINVVNNLLQYCTAPCQQCCAAPYQQYCAAPCQQLLSTTIVQLFTFNNYCSIVVDNDQQAFFINYIVSLCSNNIVPTIVLCQHRTTIDRTILINIVNSTSVVEP